jgi:hypothetical protein
MSGQAEMSCRPDERYSGLEGRARISSMGKETWMDSVESFRKRTSSTRGILVWRVDVLR